MIHLSLSLKNPWSKEKFKHIWFRVYKVTTHKFLEIEMLTTDGVVGISFDTVVNRDHSGVRLELELLQRSILINLYDSRHKDQR